MGMLVRLKDEGKIRHIGVSNVDEDQLDQALRDRAGGVGPEPLRTRRTRVRRPR